tara:strand:+ start:1144 stop:1962 length:819 start_codon:yes stop_codon:yes gene_type:complete
MKSYIDIPLAILKKDFKNALSYKMQFFGTLLTTLISISIFFLITKIFSIDSSKVLDAYENNYLKFVFLGIVFSELSFLMISCLSNAIAEYRISGTFEEILNTNIPDILIICSSYLYPISNLVIRLLIYFFIGEFLFDLNIIPDYGVFLFILFIIITFLSLLGLGLISASYTLVFFRGNPFISLYSISAAILGGTFFPYNALPDFLQNISFLIPMTHSLELLRSPEKILISRDLFFFHLYWLLSISFIYFCMGVFIFKKALKTAKKEGSLQYF